VLRTALKPRWLALFALLVLIMASFAQLGLWQLHVARDKGLAEALRKAHEARPVMVDTVVQPHQPFPNAASARPVIAIGSYAADGQVLVGPRRLEGREGYWVVTPLVVDGTGARLAVVRGFVPDPADAGTAPQERVQVTGALAPGESLYAVGAAVEDSVTAAGERDGRDYGLVEDYVGHGIGTEMHQDPQVPNYRVRDKGVRVREGLVVAIEPMLTRGSEQTRVLDDDWTVITADGSRAAHFEHTVAISDDGLWVLTAIDGGREQLERLGVPVAARD